MIRRESDGVWLELEERIAQHYEAVFGCFVDSGQLTRWFPVAAEVDLRAGGTIVLGWDEKMDRTTTIAILDFDPGGRITWDWEVGAAARHAPLYWTVEPSVEEGAIVKLRQGPFPETIEGMIELGNEAAHWRWYLCNLRSTLEAKHDMRRVRPL